MVSIITVNYNGWKDTCELIESFKRLETYPYEIIVVDNASAGDDADRISKAHPDVTVVRSEKNLGFAGGNNLGLLHARGKYIFFLNNDMIIRSPMLLPLVERLEQEHIGGVSPSIYYLYKPDQVQYYGHKELTPITLRYMTEAFDYSRRQDFLYPHETDILHGGAMMVRRDVIDRVGTMTEAYFLFYEEFDWSRRIRQGGYRLFYESDSVVYHKESMSMPSATPLRIYYLARARMIYARRNCPGINCVLSWCYQLFIAVPKHSLAYLSQRRTDLFKAVWRGAFAGLMASRKSND